MKKIPLTKGKFALVDDADFEFLNQWKWCYREPGYAHRTQYLGIVDGKYKYINIRLHRALLSPSLKLEIDHIDGDGLNNTRENLRVCTHQENMRNRRKNTKSLFKGITINKGKYQARIVIDKGKRISLGYFDDIEKASEAYVSASRHYYGVFSNSRQCT